MRGRTCEDGRESSRIGKKKETIGSSGVRFAQFELTKVKSVTPNFGRNNYPRLKTECISSRLGSRRLLLGSLLLLLLGNRRCLLLLGSLRLLSLRTKR